jgi:hypothetical protein
MPRELCGLGILNLDKFARALRVRWLWQEWTSEDKAWINTAHPCDETDKLLFTAATSICLGDGQKTNFWNSGWLGGCRPKDIAPNVFAISTKKNRNVKEALHQNTRIRDLNFNTNISVQHV